MDKNEEKYEIMPMASAPVSLLESDKLVEVAQTVERRIDALKKIKNIALRLTNPNDWIDENGRPYLQSSGAKKIARPFGISWRVEEPTIEPQDEGHYLITFKGEFSLGGATIEAIGTRSSRDKFFTTRYKNGNEITLPASEVDKGDVKKSALTNLVGNGVTSILGLQNLTWNDLLEAGIKKEDVIGIKYKKKENGKSTEIKAPDLPATEGQIKAIHAILGSLNIKDDHEKCEKVTGIIMGEGNEPIPHISRETLTKGQASKIIDSLNKEKK